MEENKTPPIKSYTRDLLDSKAGKIATAALTVGILYIAGKVDLDQKIDNLTTKTRIGIYNLRHTDPSEANTKVKQAIQNYEGRKEFNQAYEDIASLTINELDEPSLKNLAKRNLTTEKGKQLAIYSACELLATSQKNIDGLVGSLSQTEEGKTALAYMAGLTIERGVVGYEGIAELSRMGYENLTEEQKAQAEVEFFGMFRDLTRREVMKQVWKGMSQEEHVDFMKEVLPQCGVEVGQKAKEKISETGRSAFQDIQELVTQLGELGNKIGGTQNE